MREERLRGRVGIGFGLLIAYVLPGFTLLASLAFVFPPLELWLLGPTTESPAVGGVLYTTAASILLGKLINVIRWATLDRIFAITGIRQPAWNEALLQERLPAFEALVENHRRYHEFYGNMAIALPLALLAVRSSPVSSILPFGPTELFVLLMEGVLIAGSRDALRRYFRRTQALLSSQGD